MPTIRFSACLRFVLTVLCLCAMVPSAVARQGAATERLVIGTKEAAPFSFRGEDGTWQGMSIDLWRSIATDLDLEFEFKEATLKELISGLNDGSFDASVAALTVTPAREKMVDFSHAFHPSGLGIAVRKDERSSGLLAVLKNLFTVQFFKAAGTLIIVLFLGGAVVWFLERRRNPEQFGGSTADGLGSAFWWSAVTMTTVGYGDKAPVTAGGRLIGVIWMFAGIITISGLTATIASSLTVSRLEHAIQGPDDLRSIGKIACVEGSTGEEYLMEQGLPTAPFATARKALDAVANGKSQAAVYDQPILRYLTLKEMKGVLEVLPATFERQDYAFALPLQSELRKPINQALLEELSGTSWHDSKQRYLGLD